MTITTSSVSFRVLSAGGGTCLRESSGHTQSSKRVGNGVWIMKHLKKLEEEVSGWPHISVHPHRFAGREFRFLSAELGHVHTGGIIDIPFPRSIHDALLAKGLAQEHRWVPNSGWITFRIRSEKDLKHALAVRGESLDSLVKFLA